MFKKFFVAAGFSLRLTLKDRNEYFCKNRNLKVAATSNMSNKKLKILVEAAGIEPASGNLQPQVPTCLFPILILASSGAPEKAPESASPVVLTSLPKAKQKGQPDL